MQLTQNHINTILQSLKLGQIDSNRSVSVEYLGRW